MEDPEDLANVQNKWTGHCPEIYIYIYRSVRERQWPFPLNGTFNRSCYRKSGRIFRIQFEAASSAGVPGEAAAFLKAFRVDDIR